MIDFTGIDHGRLDKGGIAAIPGDPFACILSAGIWCYHQDKRKM